MQLLQFAGISGLHAGLSVGAIQWNILMSYPYALLYSTFQPLWDAFSQLLEPVSSSIPMNFIQGR